jgi:4-hydroxybenzoate polyprenyltransferase
MWLRCGKAHLKAELARHVNIDVGALPYDSDVVAWLQAARLAGRPIVLATASHRSLADAVAAHLDLFDKVFASDGEINLSAKDKRDLLVSEYGERGYDYIGNSHDDIPAWQSADHAYTVNPIRQISSINGDFRLMSDTNIPQKLGILSHALRINHWLKNILVFVPLIAAHKVGSWQLLQPVLLAFLAFNLCASGCYLINDLLDLEHDRHHPEKRNRPLASGAMPLLVGLAMSVLLSIFALTISWLFLPWQFEITLLGYYILTTIYSAAIKRVVMMDVVVLATLYTLRIIAGSFAINIFPSVWLLAFSMFLFLSMALIKRYAELYAMREQHLVKTLGRGYHSDDLPLLATLGATSGYLAVLVLALYIQDAHTAALYRHPELIWLCCPFLLWWISRFWIITYRGLMQADPVDFLIRDRTSLFVIAICGLDIWLAT